MSLFKNRIFWLFVACFIFASPLIFIGFHENHDSVTHLARAAQYVLAIKDFQIPPRWAPTINYGFGSPFFIFYYPISGYIMALLYFLGFSLEKSYLIFSIATSFIGPLFFYLWISKISDKKTAFFSSIVYIILPYRFLTLYVRGGVGEFLAFSLLPLFFYLLETYYSTKDKKLTVLAGVTFALIILSHNAISLIFAPIVIIYSLLRGRKMFYCAVTSFVLGLFLSAYFWAPALIEARFTRFNFYFGNTYKDAFAPITSFTYSSWGFGPDVNRPGGLSPQIGILAFIFFILAIIFLVLKRYKKMDLKLIIFWVMLFISGVFISSGFSKPIWDASDFLKRFQFPWRFIVVPSFAAAVLSSYVFKYAGFKKLLIGVVVLFCLFSINFINLPNKTHNPDKYYFSYKGSTSFHGEDTTVWTAGDPSNYSEHPLEIIAGDAKIEKLNKSSVVHRFVVDAKTNATIIDNTIYFPGWKVFVGGVEKPIQFQDINHKGLITFNVPRGISNVKLIFTETKIRLTSDIISLISIIGVLGYFLLGLRIRK